jgi:EAL domain-containing protein (putative c-di-GMP-specific phosphodiesterase class I)
MGQGYLFTRPAPVYEIEALLAGRAEPTRAA